MKGMVVIFPFYWMILTFLFQPLMIRDTEARVRYAMRLRARLLRHAGMGRANVNAPPTMCYGTACYGAAPQ